MPLAIPGPTPALLFAALVSGAGAQISPEPQRLFVDVIPRVVLDYDRDGIDELIATRDVGFSVEAYGVNALGTVVLERTLAITSGIVEDAVFVDIDGDGLDDLVTLERDPTALSAVLYFDRGGPILEAETSLGSVPAGMRLSVRDFDADGDVDVLFYPSNRFDPLDAHEFSLFIQTGPAFFTPVPVMMFPESLASAETIELDGDGDLDFVALRPSSGTLVIVRKDPGALRIEAVPGTGSSYVDLATGDVNGDGQMDVVAAESSNLVPFRVDLFLGTAAGGLAAPTTVFTGGPDLTDDVALLDADGDGALDIIAVSRGSTAGEHRILISAGDGAGGFGPTLFRGSGVGMPTAEQQVGRFNPDGKDDLLGLAVGTSGLSSEVRETALVRFGEIDLAGAPAGASVTEGLEIGLIGASSHFLASDFSRDGVTDIVFGGLAGSSVVAGRADESGFDSPGPVFADGKAVLAANLDDDPEDELVMQDPATQLPYIADNPAFFNPTRVDLPGAVQAFRTMAEDIDGDGDLDLAVDDAIQSELAWYENLGALSFAPRAVLPVNVPGEIASHSLGDFNGDGRIDVLRRLLIFPLFTERYSWAEGLGGGAFGPVQPLSDGGVAPVVVDLNGDGFDDLLFGNNATDQVGWIPGSANGPLPGAPRIFSAVLGPQMKVVGLVDADGDGREDLITVNRGGALVAHLGFSPGPGLFDFSDPPVPIATALNAGSTQAGAAAAALIDVGSDGDLDLVVGLTGFGLTWHENLAAGFIGTSFCGPAVPNSDGRPGRILAAGQPSAVGGHVTLRAVDVPGATFGFFITSQTQVPATPVIASDGRICLGGSIGRYVGPDQVQLSNGEGTFGLEIDLAAMPTPNGFVAAIPGSTWSFQAWHRDFTLPQNFTSNFTDGLEITVR